MLFFNPSSCASNLKEGNIIECIYIELFKRRVMVPRLKGMLHIEKKKRMYYNNNGGKSVSVARSGR